MNSISLLGIEDLAHFVVRAYFEATTSGWIPSIHNLDCFLFIFSMLVVFFQRFIIYYLSFLFCYTTTFLYISMVSPIGCCMVQKFIGNSLCSYGYLWVSLLACHNHVGGWAIKVLVWITCCGVIFLFYNIQVVFYSILVFISITFYSHSLLSKITLNL